MLDRRTFLGSLIYPSGAAFAGAFIDPQALPRTLLALEEMSRDAGTAEQTATDEGFWAHVQQAFTVDRSLVNLNNGGVSPAPALVQEAMKRHLDFSHKAPPYTMWRVLEPQREAVREQLARLFGCDPEEVAVTRNASESLQICQLGLDLEPGDEVLTTSQDYPRMLSTFLQRERREGIRLVQVPVPVPLDDPMELVRRLEQGITPRTRMILICHVINLTGQILPVRDVVRMARKRGIPVIVDGAHSFAHFPFTRDDLECDYFGTSLHKWLGAPHGTGLLYVRRELIDGLWPLMAAPEDLSDDIRKFEEIGTHPAANTLAIAEAITFLHGIGIERKAARLRHLTGYWTDGLLEHDRVRVHTNLRPDLSGAIATFQVDGIDSGELNDHLWASHRILTTAIKHADFEGIRVSPNVYTTHAELDRFVDAVEAVLENGLPENES